MAATPAVLGVQAPLSPAQLARRRDHLFFGGMAVLMILINFIGFAPTYYLGRFFQARPLGPLVHLHGLVFSLWCLLFLAQTTLVATNRVQLHRKLGVAGILLAATLLVVGYLTAIEAARLSHGPPTRDPRVFLTVPLGTLVGFAILFGVGIWKRKDRHAHKRLVLLATISILAPAFARMRFINGGGPTVYTAGIALLVFGCWAWDRWANGRIHPAFLWGGIFVVFLMPLRIALGHTTSWRPIADWLIGT